MSLQIDIACSVPEETQRVARAAFPKGNSFMRMRDEFGNIYEDRQFADLFPPQGQPAEAPWRLALVTLMQFAEGLSDRQAAQAVRSRIDWKYALGLELTDSGFDHSVLCEFRARLLEGEAEARLFETMLALFKERGFVKAHSRQRTDPTHVVGAIRSLNRLESVGETLRAALEELAEIAPEWLKARVSPDWFDRYGARIEEYRLPQKDAERASLAETIGQDGWKLLEAAYSAGTPASVAEAPAIEILRRVWVQQYHLREGQLRWRSAEDLPPARQLIRSPYDPEATLSQKRSTLWTGYKVHLTETCEPEEVHLITDVQTTSAPTADVEVTALIHTALAKKERLPGKHLVDTGYVDADLLIQSQANHQVEIVGPVLPDGSWQGRAQEGFDISCFEIDWECHKATCPQGKISRYWKSGLDRRGQEEISIGFTYAECQACPDRPQCTRSKTSGRQLTVRPQAQHETLQAARQRQIRPEWKAEYDPRAGIEGTISEGVRAFGLRRCRYQGLAKTHLQHLMTAAAMNWTRMAHWLEGKPHASTRISRFVSLAA